MQLSVEQLREEVKKIFSKTESDDLALVWLLGEIQGGKIYKNWGYGSFRDWWNEEGGATISMPHAYALARIGRVFLPQKDSINERFKKKEITIRQLINLAKIAEDGNRDDTGASISDVPAGEPNGLVSPVEPRQKLVASIPTGDMQNMIAGLTIQALAAKVNTLSDAVRSIGIEAYLFGLSDQSDLREYEKYRVLILEGKFFCACCNKIPLNPTFHHILPVSIGRGYGPQALLCWEPCHEQVVQPKWRVYCERWGKTHGFTVQALKTEAEKQISEGEVDGKATLIITGRPIGIG